MTLMGCAVTALAGCSSTASLDSDRASRVVVDHIPSWAGGEPSSVPPPQTPPQPLDIFATPSARPAPKLDASEQKQLQADLVALRNRNLDRGKAAKAVNPADRPTLSADRLKPAAQAAVSTPGAASRHSPDGPS
jgi:hypothetical protein